MEEPSKPVPDDDAPWAKGKGPPFSFFPQSFRSFLSFPFVCFFGLVRFLLLSTQFSVFVRDHLRRKDRYKFCGGAAVKVQTFNKHRLFYTCALMKATIQM